MPTMSLDFSITQLYRLFADDLLMMYDALVFYRKFKKDGRTVKEFSEILANLVDVESENFEEIRNITKSTHANNENISIIVWDYFHDILMKHFLDDISQYPFWAAKIAVTTKQHVFGLSLVQLWLNTLQETYNTRGMGRLFQGLFPYLLASVIINYKYVLISTNEFVLNVLSKIPNHASNSVIDGQLGGNQQAIPQQQLQTVDHIIAQSKQLLRGSGPTSGAVGGKNQRRNSSKRLPVVTPSIAEIMVSNAAVVFLSHPLLVTSVSMVTDPTLRGFSWVGAYWQLLARNGVRGFYRGIRTRTILALLPLSPLLLLGISDCIVYRRILGQGTADNAAGGLISVLREMVSREGGGALSLLNYGLITAVQVVPGFLSFLAVRLASRLFFGTSLQRKHQISRRKEIVDSQLSTISKKSTTATTGFGSTMDDPAANGPPAFPHAKGISRNRSAHFGV